MKKKFLFFIFSTFILTASQAQIRKIPFEVTDALKAKYPTAEKVEWKDKLSYFEAQFNLDGIKTYADFSSKGEWQETDKELNFDALPAAVKDGYNKSKYTTDWKTGSVVEIKKPDGSTQYRIYIEKNDVQKKYLYFSEDGKLIREALTL
ncbi:MAG: PepSY-like domain-containing protein [Chitinophagaceae bacterium]